MTDGSYIPPDAIPKKHLIKNTFETQGVEKDPESEIMQQALQWHDEFIQQKWKDSSGKARLSFHNREHIETVWKAAVPLIDKAIQLTAMVDPTTEQKVEYDPLNIIESVKKIIAQLAVEKNIHIELKDALPLFKRAMQTAVATHDLGNLMQTVDEDGQGKLVPQWHEKGFKAQGAEDRSREIAARMIDKTDLPTQLSSEHLEIYMEFISQFHDRTKFNPQMTAADREKALGVFAPFIDQLSGELLLDPDKQEQRVFGLLTEMASEFPDVEINPDRFRNFLINRYKQIVPDRDVRSDLEHIAVVVGGEVPFDYPGYRTEMVKANDILENPSLMKYPLPSD